MNLYIVGPLFTEAEEKQRRYEGNVLRSTLQEHGVMAHIDNPIEFPVNGAGNITAAEIYQADYQRLSDADVVFFDLSNEDSGSCVALGLIMEKKLQGKPIAVYPVIHDLRLSRNGMSGLESSCGFNSMMVGILKGNGIVIYDSFDAALIQFKKDQGWEA